MSKDRVCFNERQGIYVIYLNNKLISYSISRHGIHAKKLAEKSFLLKKD